MKPPTNKLIISSLWTFTLGALAWGAAVLPARADYSSTVQSFHPAAYWRLNETIPVPPADAAANFGSAGPAAQGLYLNGATHGVPGAMAGSSAAQFSGGAWAGVPNSAALNPNPPFSIEFWINPNPVAGALTCPLSSTDFSMTPRLGWLFYTDDGYSGGYVNGGYYFRVYSSAGTIAVTSPAGILVNGWTHVVGVVDGAHVILYVNGQPVGSAAWSGTFTPNVIQPVGIGARYDSGFAQDGSMDDVAIYGVALSATDVKAHYDAATANAAGYATQILAANPAAYWRLNESSYTAPDPSTLPAAVNLGTLGTDANGTYQPGAATQVAGPPYSGLGTANYGCRFNGLEGYIDCGATSGFDISGPISIMTWMKVTAFNKSWQAIVTKGDSAWRVHRNSSGSDTPEVGFSTTGVSDLDQAGTRNVSDGLWHHVVAVYDHANKYIYVDGTLDSSVPATGDISANTYSVFIGENAQSTGRVFDGVMDEVAIFTNALSADQVLQIYNAANVPPMITQQPQAPAGNVYEGMAVSFQVTAIGDLPLAYQWTKNGTSLPGKTTAAFLISDVTTNDSGIYAVVITNAYGTVTSSVVAFNAQFGPPVIFQQPQSVSRFPGGSATFSVVAGGSAPIAYQWTNSAGVIPGATSASYTRSGLTTADAGNYGVILTNPYGTTNSAAASLTLLPVTNYAAVVMAGGPLTYWRMNETSGTVAYDYASGYNASDVGGVTVGQPGPRGPAFPGFEAGNDGALFDGTTSSSCSSGVSLLNNRTNFTMCGWINPSVIQQGGFFGQNDVVEFRFNGASPTQIELWTPYGSINYDLNGDVVAGNWTFLAASGTANTLKLYINGQQVASATTSATGGYGTSTSPFLITGNTSGNGDASLSGVMDEVALYPRTLSAFEIGNLYYNATTTSPVPVFTQQPQSTTRYAGATAIFSAQLNGSVPMTYQWQHASTDLPRATSATLVLSNVSPADAGSYVLKVTNPAGNASSTPATLTVVALPSNSYAASVMADRPVAYWGLNETTGTTAYDYAGGDNGTNNNGASLGMVGPTPPLYPGFEANNTCYQFDGASSFVQAGSLGLSGPVSVSAWVNPSSLAGEETIVSESGSWVFKLSGGELRLTTPGILDHTSSGAGVTAGDWQQVAVSFDPGVPGGAKFYRNGQLISAVDASAMTQGNSTVGIASDQWGEYFPGQMDEVAVYDQVLSADAIASTYAEAAFSTTTAPFVTRNPASQTVPVGSTVLFSAAVQGSLPLSYQWKKDGVSLPGATDATLARPDIYFTDAGSYVLWATNGAGHTNTASATLSVMPPPTFANVTNGLVLHLRFDGDYSDSSGSGNDAYAQGSLPFLTGKIGQAVHVATTPGINYLVLAAAGNLSFDETASFSISFWIRYTDPFNDDPIIGNAINSTWQLGWVFTDEGGKLEWSLASTPNTSTYLRDPVGPAVIGDGAWHNIIGVVDRGRQMAFAYVDGVLDGGWSIAGLGSLDSGNLITIGQDPGGSYGSATFDLDDLAIWRRAFTAYEAASVYGAAQNSGESFDVYGPIRTSVNQVGTNVDVSWPAGTLLQSTNVTGPYKAVTGATVPFYRTTATGSSMFFRVQQ